MLKTRRPERVQATWHLRIGLRRAARHQRAAPERSIPEESTRRRTGKILTQGSYVAFRRAPRAIATSFRNQNRFSAQKTAEHIKNAAWTPAPSASHGFASRFQ